MSQTDCPSKYRLCNTRNYFILKLGNTANNNSIFNTKHAEFSTIRFPLYVSVHFSPTHLIMQPHLHSLPTMPSSPEPFLTSLFHLSLYLFKKTISIIPIDTTFLYNSAIQPIQAASSTWRAREFVRNNTVLISLLHQSMDRTRPQMSPKLVA